MTQVSRPRKCYDCGSPIELTYPSGPNDKWKHSVSWGCKRKNPTAAVTCSRCKRPIMKPGPKRIQFGCLCPPPIKKAEPVKLEPPPRTTPVPKPKAKPKPQPKVSLVKANFVNRVDKERIRKNLARHVPYSTMRVFERDKWTCYLCKRPVARYGQPPGPDTPLLKATKEHVVPISLGGEDTFYNVRLACGPCNNLKGNETGMINLLDLLELLPPQEQMVPEPEPVRSDTKEETITKMDYIILYLTRMAFFLVTFLGLWWMLDQHFSIARFMIGGLVVGAVVATAEATE